jgi:DNA-binding NarL/FixJ family response regulator
MENAQAPIPPRQAQILARIQQGKSDKEIGKELFISEETVAFHLRKLFTRFHVHSRLELLIKTT